MFQDWAVINFPLQFALSYFFETPLKPLLGGYVVSCWLWHAAWPYDPNVDRLHHPQTRWKTRKPET